MSESGSERKQRVLARLNEWDICASGDTSIYIGPDREPSGDRRYFIVLPKQGIYLETSNLATAEYSSFNRRRWSPLMHAMTTLWNDEDPGKVKIAMSTTWRKIYCILTGSREYIRTPTLYLSGEMSSRTRCSMDWMNNGTDHVCCSEDRFYSIRGNRYAGTRHMRTGRPWYNTIHPDFCRIGQRDRALKYFAANGLWYAVYWDDESDKFRYRRTTNMHSNANACDFSFSDILMFYIPGYDENYSFSLNTASL